MGVILATILSAASLSILINAVIGYVIQSTVGSGMVMEFINLIGKRRVFNVLDSPWPFFLKQLCFILLAMFYFFLFYKHEKRRVFLKDLNQLIADTKKYVINPEKRVIPVYRDKNLVRLTESINMIINKMDTVIEEERSAQKTKNDLITNVSHDLRTPLTSILGYLALIIEDNYKDEVELRYYIDIAYEKSTKLHRLIQDLFEYTRVQNHQLTVEKVPLNIKEMLGQLAEHYRIQFEQMQFVCKETYSSEALIIEADGNLLIRVFENLLSNALKYGTKKKQIDISAYVKDDDIVVEVTSYGEPIRAMDLPHIFERFYQVDKSRGLHSDSSGLGLAIAKSIVDMHDGEIKVISEEEKTVFAVYLKWLNV
ncbi:sensor histidine kinase [Sporosarcina limicola]|uniref:histidine kinase n=1 Tax=Sporosarcina limicola TaxID=34101 RepID=A0A927MN64_9BACL|nr:ATP-binding protein [Sporosarcina limicola]MBE1555957.1 signal transduction histidine kinase [Sporosarcina limicola]